MWSWIHEHIGKEMKFLGAMFLIFMTLKLCKVIAWSWVWVTCPLWILFAFMFATMALGFLGLSTAYGLSAFFSRKKRPFR
jgi:hypothetical protein